LGGTDALVSGEHQEFGVNGQHLGGEFLQVPPCLDSWTNQIHPIGRNRFDPLLAAGHIGEGPKGMALAFGAMARRLSAPAAGKNQRAWECIFGNGEASQKEAGAAAETGDLWTAGEAGKPRVEISARMKC
jgi:hypothetical protein